MDGLTVSVRGLRFAYERGATVLDIAELDIAPGLTLLSGANGAGKTTLLRILAGVDQPDAGVVTIGGRNLWIDEVEARRPIAYVPEHPDVSPFASVGEVVALVARLRARPASEGLAALEAAGLASLTHRTIRELSLGQRRRVHLAAAMVGTPQVLLLDEPLESLDAAMAEGVVTWVRAAVLRQATVLIATHRTGTFEDLATGAWRMDGGRVVP